MLSVEQLLRTHGPCLSSVIRRRLEEEGLPADTARKRIERSGPAIIKSWISFPHRERFICVREHEGTPAYFDRLIAALDSSNTAHGVAIRSLEGRGGIVPLAHFPVISGSPLLLKGHINLNRLLEGLTWMNLVQKKEVPGVGNCLSLTQAVGGTIAPARLRARLLAEDILLRAVRDWLKKLNLVSYNVATVRTLDSAPSFGQFQWDLTAPSYVMPLVTITKNSPPSPGFFVADVSLNPELSEAASTYFVKKCGILRQMRNMRPFMAMLVATRFSESAFAAAKRHGLIFATPENLLGRDVAAALLALLEVMTGAGEAFIKDPSVVSEIFSRLGSIEGAAANLRGPLFEFIVGHCVREKQGNTIELGREIVSPRDGERAQIDVLRIKERQEICIYECKGKIATSRVSLTDVQTWFEKKVPRMVAWARSEERFRNCDLSFEFWTTAKFEPAADDYLKDRQRKLEKYSIRWRNGSEVRNYVRGIGATSLVRVLDEHYLSHPLVKTLDEE